MSAEIPDRIGPYTVTGLLDTSGDRNVYKVDGGGRRALAVKLYPAAESDDLRSFRRDALTAAAGVRNPGLMRYEEVGEHDGRVYASMELFPSTALLQHPMPLHRTLRVMRQLAGGLAGLHQSGVAHGCLNPARALVSTAGDSAKLTESGMSTESRPAAMEATATLQLARMARYLAPELRSLSTTVPDSRSDIYSFGVLFYEVLTGKVPEGRFRLPSQESDQVPPQLDQVVLRCLRQNPADRQRAGDLVDAIDRVQRSLPGGIGQHLETLTSSARGALDHGAESTRGRRWGVWTGLAVVALVVAALAGRACI